MKKAKIEQTPVIFRKFKDGGQVIALFVQVPANCDPHLCSSYMHIGQHGACYLHHVYKDTVPATEEEYSELAEELTSIGYNLKIRTRYTWHDADVRQEKIAQLRKEA